MKYLNDTPNFLNIMSFVNPGTDYVSFVYLQILVDIGQKNVSRCKVRIVHDNVDNPYVKGTTKTDLLRVSG